MNLKHSGTRGWAKDGFCWESWEKKVPCSEAPKLLDGLSTNSKSIVATMAALPKLMVTREQESPRRIVCFITICPE